MHAQYCSCVTVCAHCTCIVYNYCRLSNSIVLHVVYCCVFINIVACILPCMQEWTRVEAKGGPGQPWPEDRNDHSAVSLYESDSNPANPELFIMWGADKNDKPMNDGWVYGVNVQQWRKVRQSVSNSIQPTLLKSQIKCNVLVPTFTT